MNLPATEHDQTPQQRNAAMKFTYPSGSRPLEGYTIKRGIGRGGFGEVYYALSDGGKEVALKHIRRNLEIELRGVSQCLNLKHANLLALYDIRRDANDDTWVVMEYVGGQSLEDVIAAHPQGMPPHEALVWFQGIAAGVGYLHDRGIVHRDLKPGNVFSDEGGVKIGDYGLSKFISVSRRSGQTESVGTVHYMAPEVANGRYGKEIDVYALGVMFYEMLTGHVPFEGESVGEVLMKHLTAQPDLSRLAPPYRAVVARALEKDPQLRWSSVAEFAAAMPRGDGWAPPPPPPPRERPVPPLAETRVYQPAVAAQTAPRPVRLLFDEPVFVALRSAWRENRAAWARAELAQPVRIAILVFAVLGVLSFGGLLVPPLIFYLIYLGGRAVYLAAVQPTTTDPLDAAGKGTAAPFRQTAGLGGAADSAPPAPEAPPMRPSGYQRRASVRARSQWVLGPKSIRETATELLGSLLVAATAVAAGCVLLSVIGSFHPEELVWLALVGTLASWAVLVPAKFWEGRRGDELLRRFALVCCGLVVALAAVGFDAALKLDLPRDARWRPAGVPEPAAGLTDVFGQPALASYLTFFALLFLARWWRVADPRRAKRLSIGAVMGGVAWGFLASLLSAFPLPLGVYLAGIMEISVQLASPWAEHAEAASPRAT